MSNRTDAVERARGRWNAGDLPGYLALYGQGIRLHGYTPEPMGKAEIEGFYRSIIVAFDSRGDILSHCRSMFEAVTRATTDQPDIFEIRMPID